MVTKQREYLSVILRTLGFGLFAPLGSVLFQWFVFEKSPYFGHFLPSVMATLLGIMIMYVGFNILKEKTNE